jgi:hypothetical protein
VKKGIRYVHKGNNSHQSNTGLQSSKLPTKIISITPSVLLHQRRINHQLPIHQPQNPQRQNEEILGMGKYTTPARAANLPHTRLVSTHHTQIHICRPILRPAIIALAEQQAEEASLFYHAPFFMLELEVAGLVTSKGGGMTSPSNRKAAAESKKRIFD